MARRYGSGCRRLVEAVARDLDGVGTIPASKAADALRDGAAVPTGHPLVYRFVSSDGTRYYLTHPKKRTCPAGIRGIFCYHRIVVSVLSGVWVDDKRRMETICIGRRSMSIQSSQSRYIQQANKFRKAGGQSHESS
jgi:hypothetical protein